MTDLNNLLRIVLESEVEFVLIGGFAGVVHGSTQVTRDIDICATIDPEMIEKLRHALRDLEPRHRMNPNFKPSFLEEPKDAAGLRNIYLETKVGVLDVIGEVMGVGDFDRLSSRAVEIELFGRSCRVISIEDLIASKQALGRGKDKIVVGELMAILKLSKG